jgi:hypothetical protein
MTIRKLVLVAAAASLSGCASMEASAPNQSGSLQNAVYVVGQNGATVQQASVQDQTPTMPGESRAMRLYWFLGGR